MDWTLAFFLLIGVLLGLKNGLSRELPRLLETLLSLCVTFASYSFFAEWLSRETPLPETYSRALTFGLAGFLSWLCLRLLFEILGKLVQLQVVAPFQALGGLLIGGVRYFIFFSLISYLLLLFPLDWIHNSYQVQSWSGQTLAQIPAKIYETVKGLGGNLAVQKGTA